MSVEIADLRCEAVHPEYNVRCERTRGHGQYPMDHQARLNGHSLARWDRVVDNTGEPFETPGDRP